MDHMQPTYPFGSRLGESRASRETLSDLLLRSLPVQIVAVVEVDGCSQRCGRVLAPLQHLLTGVELLAACSRLCSSRLCRLTVDIRKGSLTALAFFAQYIRRKPCILPEAMHIGMRRGVSTHLTVRGVWLKLHCGLGSIPDILPGSEDSGGASRHFVLRLHK